MEIRIVQRPEGEAPEWVRDAWIGLNSPLVDPRRRRLLSFGVLSGPQGWWRQWWEILRGRGERVDGYVVNAAVAVDLLHRTQPAAADWWRAAAAQMLDGRQTFIFDLAACEVIPDAPELSR